VDTPRGLALLLSAAGVVAAALVAVPLLRAFARTVIYPGAPLPFPEEAELRASFPSASVVRYAAPGGPELTGAIVRGEGESLRPLLLFFHGNGECAAWNLPLAAALAARGFDVFLAEYRGYGGAGGKPTEEGLVEDGEAAVAEARRQGYGKERLVLVGRSLGTGVATELALRGRGAALVLVSPYTSIVDMGRGLAGPLAPLLVPDRFDNAAKLPRLEGPVVILHGGLDDVVPVGMGRALAALRPSARYVEVAQATHNDFPGLADLVAVQVREALGE